MSREADLYKDKIEVSLDGRQIFYLFFGGAVIVGLVFVLGVMVGRRVEARGHVDRARTTAAVDPLAALDRLEDKGGLSFQGSLTGGTAPTSDVEHAIGAIEKARAGKPVKVEAPKVEAPKVEPKKLEEPKVEPKKIEELKKEELKKIEEPKKADVAKKSEEPKKLDEAKKPDEPKKPDEAKKPDEPKKLDESKKLADKPKDEKKKSEEPKKVEEPKLADADKPKAEPKEEEKKPKYTLQLSSFQDRAEADAFLSSLKGQGYQAHVTEATVSGKGTFYRVRMGSYKSIEAANDAKSEFEKASKKSASVMKL